MVVISSICHYINNTFFLLQIIHDIIQTKTHCTVQHSIFGPGVFFEITGTVVLRTRSAVGRKNENNTVQTTS